jgi:hypothetical protein
VIHLLVTVVRDIADGSQVDAAITSNLSEKTSKSQAATDCVCAYQPFVGTTKALAGGATLRLLKTLWEMAVVFCNHIIRERSVPHRQRRTACELTKTWFSGGLP